MAEEEGKEEEARGRDDTTEPLKMLLLGFCEPQEYDWGWEDTRDNSQSRLPYLPQNVELELSVRLRI